MVTVYSIVVGDGERVTRRGVEAVKGYILGRRDRGLSHKAMFILNAPLEVA